MTIKYANILCDLFGRDPITSGSLDAYIGGLSAELSPYVGRATNNMRNIHAAIPPEGVITGTLGLDSAISWWVRQRLIQDGIPATHIRRVRGTRQAEGQRGRPDMKTKGIFVGVAWYTPENLTAYSKTLYVDLTTSARPHPYAMLEIDLCGANGTIPAVPWTMDGWGPGSISLFGRRPQPEARAFLRLCGMAVPGVDDA